MIKVITVCPLGCECEKVTSEGIERCAWFVKLRGKDPQTGEEIDESRCSMAWQPVLMIEGNGIGMQTNASVQSMRNETIDRQEMAIRLVGAIQNDQKILTNK